MANNYRPDPRGTAALGRSAEVGRAMEAAAEVGKADAIRRAPRRTGRYAASFEVQPAEVVGGRRNERRAGAILRNTTDYALAVEGQSRTLREAARAIEEAN